MPETTPIQSRKIALVVLGMHRSGTSAITRLLSLAGAALPEVVMQAAPDNPTGFWEPADVVNLNNTVMEKFDSAWDDIFSGVVNSAGAMADQTLLETAARMIHQNYGGADLIVLKDPRVAVLVPFWRRVLEMAGYSPRYLIMVRNPMEVAASLMKRNGFSREKALLLWSTYMVAAERDTREARRTFVSYDGLLEDWRGVLNKVERDLGVALPRRTGTASVETDRFLQSSLRHHVHTRPLEEQSQLWLPVRNLYDWLNATAEGRAMPNMAPDQVGEQLAELHALFGPVVAELQLHIGDLHGRLTNKDQEGAEAKNRIETLEAELLDAAARGRAERVEELSRTIAALQDDLVASLRQQGEAAAESEAHKSQAADLVRIIDELQHDLAAGQTRHNEAMASLREQGEAAAATAEAAAAEREAHRAETAALARVIDELQHDLAAGQSRHNEAQALLQAQSAERDALLKTVEEGRIEVDALAERRDELDARVRELQALNTAAQSDLSESRNALSRSTLAVEALQGQQAGWTIERDTMNAAIDSLWEINRKTQAERDDTLRQAQHFELMVDETRLAAALESRTLRRHLHEQTKALRTANEEHGRLLASYEALTTSTSWRLTGPLRKLLADRGGVAVALRNGLKLVYWTATFQLGARLRRRREFFAQHAASAAVVAAVQSPKEAQSQPAGQPPQISVFSYAKPAAIQDLPPEPSRRTFAWETADAPHTPAEALGLYDCRPDDSIPREQERGRIFMERFELLSAKPKFHDAAQYLNAKRLSALRQNSAATPKVSIIIPIYGQLAYTLNCLDSLLDHESAASFEILIGDDVSPDDSGDILPLIDGVRTIRHAQNGGFVLNCNWTAAAARGDYVVFLNNDTRVAPRWLDEMIDSFTLFPKAGLVGSKLFYPDGVLQEAGGIVWRDGSAWNYGREQDPNRPEFCYARQVDYISGAAIALPRALWNELSGFDELYKPAYCEDLDLALRVRSIGREVWMQPLSRVIHYEGRTSGTDTGQGVKAFQVVNLAKVYDRWSAVLATHRPNAEDPLLEKDRNVEKRALIIDVGTPTPDQDAGSVVTVATIRIYQGLGYKVTFLPRDNFLFDPVYTQQLQRMGVECIYAPYEIDFAEFMKRQGRHFDVVQIFRPGVAEQCVADIRLHAPQAPIIFHNVDLHYLRMQRQAEVDNDAALHVAAAAMKVREMTIMRIIDCMIVISTAEQEILQKEAPDTPIVVFPYMTEAVGTATGFNPRRDIMFLGGFRHTPNIDAAEWLITEIWPRVADELPEANLLIVGPEAPDHIRAHASDRIDITGRAAELQPYFDRTRVFVAPIRYGAGVKGKVATAMAHGVPVVATSVAAEGMFVVNERDLMIADDPAEIAQHILKLYRDEQEWQRFSTASVQFVQDHNSDAVGRRVILETIDIASRVRGRALQQTG